ncbi:MAG TPA: hypothetical protein VFF28_02585 [Candidatus Nanoarchaeia archaeon]|nr:hypothetical protein [Candidatus Nanoarchaeia archaeon]
MSEIAIGAHAGVLTWSKPAISECIEMQSISNKPEICRANFSVHAQEHAPGFSPAVLDIPGLGYMVP